MKNKLLLIMIISIFVYVVPGLAFGWGAATHAYIAKELGYDVVFELKRHCIHA
jgi:hypothetical protein